jgi:hypothetical protein
LEKRQKQRIQALAIRNYYVKASNRFPPIAS